MTQLMFPKAVFRRLVFALLIVYAAVSAFAGAGGVDTTFNVVVNNTVYSLLTRSDGKILIGGSFTTVAGVSRNGLARLYPDGTLDTTLSNSISGGGTVYAMLMQPDGKLLIAGSFNATSQTRQNVARLNVDGSLDGTFTNVNPGGTIFALGLQNDGKVLIGGQFSALGYPTSSHNYIARLNSDGTLDNTFNAGNIAGNMVNAIAVQGDGNILIGGTFNSFTTYSLTRNNIARLTTNGTPDLAYQPIAGSTIQSVFLQNDGRSMWGGLFNSLDSSSRGHVGRLNLDGTLDGGFTANIGANGTVYAVTEDTNGNVYAGGTFSEYNNSVREGVARVFSDGTLDSSFNNTTNFIPPQIRCLALQSDGKVLAGGTFTAFNSVGRTNLVRLYGNIYPADIVTQPRSLNAAIGTNVTFSVDVSNPTVVNYQWRKDGTDISGANFSQYSLFNVQLADAGNYSVFASAGLGGATSSNALLQVGTPPAITQQPAPANLTVNQGQTATFTAAASGTPLNYYWKLGAKSVAGTNATLILTNVTPAQAGSYVLVVSNFLGSVTSAQVFLTVLSPIAIALNPADLAAPVGGVANFSVSATGYPLKYQWLKGGNPINNATASFYSITNVMLTDAGGYSVIVSNQFNSVTSSVANLSVGYPPSVTTQPISVTNNLGDTTAFNCAVAGNTPITFQWLFNGNPLTNQNTTNLTLTNVQIGSIGNYALSAANAFGSTVSSNAFLNLNGYPSNLYFGLMAFYPFNGNANDAVGTNNGIVFGATLSSDRFGNTNQAYYFDGTTNYVQLPASAAVFGSQDFTISMWFNPLTYPDPTIPLQAACFLISKGQNNFELSTGSLTSATGMDFLPRFASGNQWNTPASTYLTNIWQHVVAIYQPSTMGVEVFLNGISLALTGPTNTPVGSDNSTPATLGLRTDGTLAFNGFLDEVRIYNRALSTNDVQQLYAFESGQTIIVQQPQSLMVFAGAAASFSVQAAGAGTLGYQWYYSNAPVANATNPVLTLPSVQAADAGAYYVMVSNNSGSLPSSVANLMVGTPPQTLQVHLSPDNFPSIQMPGTPGFNYVLQTATNLMPPVLWQSITNLQADTHGLWTYMDTNVPSSGSRFYRIATP
ncbi:MAG: hypothetical protein JWQ04_3560 [Pedosphaera sp.]|nr:hypothetical protein [Pedosphaera sp.]